MVAYSFNAQQYEPRFGGGGGLPANPDGSPAKYKVIVSDSSQETTQDQQGGYIRLECKVIEGPCTGQTQDMRLNVHNKSQKAVEIANKQLAAVCAVVGKPYFQDTAELYNIPFIIEVRKQRNNPEYTEIGNIFDLAGNEPGKSKPGATPQAQPPQQAAPPPQQAPQSAPAWPGQAPQQAPQQAAWPQQPQAQQAPQSAPAWPGQAPQQAPPWGQ